MMIGNVFWTAGISCLYFSFLQLFWGSERSLIQVLPVVGYTVYMIIAGRKHAVYWEKLRTFKVHAVVLVIELFAGLVMEKEMTVMIGYILAYLLFSSIALNLFRFGKTVSKNDGILYVLQLGAFALVCMLCAGVYSFILRTGGKIVEILLTPFAYLLAGFVSLGSGVTQLLRSGAEIMMEESAAVEESVEQGQQTVVEQSVSQATDATWLDWLMEVLPIVLLILVFAYVVYRIFCFYKDRYVYREDEVKVEETYEKVGRKGFGRIKLFKTNREKVCREYAKYMRSVRVQGYRIGKSSTSLDICNEAKVRLNRENVEDERIRELYMKAKYSEETVTDDDVKEMRQLV